MKIIHAFFLIILTGALASCATDNGGVQESASTSAPQSQSQANAANSVEQSQSQAEAEREREQAAQAERERQLQAERERARQEAARIAAEEQRRAAELARQEAAEAARRAEAERQRREVAAQAAREMAAKQQRIDVLRAQIASTNTSTERLEAANAVLRQAVVASENLTQALTSEQQKYANTDPDTGEVMTPLDPAGIEALQAETAQLIEQAESLMGQAE